MRFKLILLLVLIVLFTIFVSQNTEQTIMTLFFWTIDLPKIVLLIITLAVGVILGLIVATMFGKNKKMKNDIKPVDEKVAQKQVL